MWLENTLKILSAIQLPHVLLVIFLIVFVAYRKEIGQRLAKSQITLPGGFQIGGDQAAAKEPPEPTERQLASPMVEAQVEHIRRELDALNVPDREHRLMQELAVAQFYRGFEVVYRTAWASQLRALRQLNSRSDGMTREQLQPMQPEATAAQQSFDNWLGYLVTMNLVTQAGERVLISEIGVAFLTYLVPQGYPENGLFPAY